MTREQVTLIKDNLTGATLNKEDVVVVEFTVHDQAYTMDLSKKNADDFYALLKDYEDVADRVEVPEEEKPEEPEKPKRTVKTLNAGSFENTQQVREWARKQGGKVAEAVKGEGGRLANIVIDAWNEAHPAK